MENITIRVIDNRTGEQFDYQLNADLSDQLLASIVTHLGYQGENPMQCAIDYWISKSLELLESQIRTAKSAEAEAEIATLRTNINSEVGI